MTESIVEKVIPLHFSVKDSLNFVIGVTVMSGEACNEGAPEVVRYIGDRRGWRPTAHHCQVLSQDCHEWLL